MNDVLKKYRAEETASDIINWLIVQDCTDIVTGERVRVFNSSACVTMEEHAKMVEAIAKLITRRMS